MIWRILFNKTSGREITGKASGAWTYISTGEVSKNSPEQSAAFFLTRELILLAEPFLGLKSMSSIAVKYKLNKKRQPEMKNWK